MAHEDVSAQFNSCCKLTDHTNVNDKPRTEKDIPSVKLLDLPDDMLYAVMSFCDRKTLGRLGRVCRRLKPLVKSNHLWLSFKRGLLPIGWSSRCQCGKISVIEHCRLAVNWTKGYYRIKPISAHKRQMPCLQLCDDNLWSSCNNTIKCFELYGKISRRKQKTIQCHTSDVCHFVINERLLVSGAVDGSISVNTSSTGEKVMHIQHGHNGDVQTIDILSDIIVSGSRDGTAKIWRIEPGSHCDRPISTTNIGDRICSLAINPSTSSFVIGTSGIGFLPPLQVWDLDRVTLLGSLGSNYRHGAGVLDIQYESPNILLTCGYDTLVRLWDLRAPYHTCKLSWEEPYDNTIYCVRSGGDNAVLTGSARHALVELWDKRNVVKPVRLFFTSHRSSSPVYSLAFNDRKLYVGLDLGINMLDFN